MFRIGKFLDRMYISGCQELGKGINGIWQLMGMKFLLEMLKMFWNQLVVILQSYKYLKSHHIVHFEVVNLWYVNYFSVQLNILKL